MNKCLWCQEQFWHKGWQHPDRETQELFYQTADLEDAEVCSEQCWKGFMEASYAHWNEY